MSDQRLRELERRWRATGSTTDRDAYVRELRRGSPEQVYLVYRTPYEDPGCKRLVKLRGTSVLEWFQRGWKAAARWKLADDAEEWDAEGLAYEWVRKEVKGSVYGLSSIFSAARFHQLPLPTTWAELKVHLDEHLYVEGGLPNVDEPTVRVWTDDDEIDLAYYLFTQSAVDLAPERLSYLVHRGFRLPTASAPVGEFEPRIDLPAITPTGDGEGATYLVDMTIRDANMGELEEDGAVRVLPGVRVPGLADYLRSAVADTDWPTVFFGLRAALGPKERTLSKALQRCLEYDTEGLGEISAETYAEARAEVGRWWERRGDDPPTVAEASKRQASKHLLQLGRWARWKFDRWIVFDDLWASANPDLAQSLLWYGVHWDPFR